MSRFVNLAVFSGLLLLGYLVMKFVLTLDECVVFMFPGPGFICCFGWLIALGEAITGEQA